MDRVKVAGGLRPVTTPKSSERNGSSSAVSRSEEPGL